jgi:hypothetical protein
VSTKLDKWGLLDLFANQQQLIASTTVPQEPSLDSQEEAFAADRGGSVDIAWRDQVLIGPKTKFQFCSGNSYNFASDRIVRLCFDTNFKEQEAPTVPPNGGNDTSSNTAPQQSGEGYGDDFMNM